ncbi:uncharacterized protein CELE_ZK1058.9 [Caenorhabditis elegans]|uniref:Uncharacterized protein n=2 Tax=Caenorhabditis elegans TaxID=6239 RepID=C9IY21_CAEEL|nr:Uncharacterized protein CELE_ZK1058.9 [Caenorhabditis elegans]CBG22755.1 Uncharacterized protein CELE_ZK1058.9 [Caenorhabditis elegans]|eukprot:NP_001254883.1 Uncharacterized protein CELE_ZK1058.9 [Caenorhabditis elegans]
MVASSVKLDPIFEDGPLLPLLPEEKNPPGHRFHSEPTRANALAAAKRLLDDSRGQSWEKLARKYTLGLAAAPCVERLTEEELEESLETMPEYNNYRFNRSRSVDLSSISREKYLSRWSRENTPVDNEKRYASHVRRSYTPVREISAVNNVNDGNLHRSRTPLATVTAPYHTNIHYRSENEPFRKYDVYGLRTWSYPIYKYVYGREGDYRRPYSFDRNYGLTPSYTPPQLTAESRPITTRRGYSGYSYLANETHYDITSRPKSLSSYMYSNKYLGTTAAPWYWSCYGNSGLRHFNSYRPHNYTSSTASWSRYY